MDTIMTFFTLAGTFLTASLLPALLLVIGGLLVIRIVMKLLSRLLEKTKLEATAAKLIGNVARIALFILLALMVADKLGIDVTGVVALASVLTLAISLSVQNALSNVIGGFTLLYTKPFAVGDFVEIAGQSGTVESIGLTYTRLVTPDNKQVSIPNSAVVATQIVNYTAAGTRRVDITVSAAYTAPVETVLEALKEAAQLPTALDTPAPFAAVKSYGDSAIVYLLQIWCASADFWSTTCEANKRIKEVFDAKGIDMTYPHLNVHIEK